MKNLLLICISYLLYINAAIACEPTSNFTYNQNSDYSPTVEFASTSSENSVLYEWKYQSNDNNIMTFSTEENPVFTFPSSGLYAVTLTVTNFCGSDDFIQFVNVECEDPLTDFSINSQSDPQDMTITFQNNSTGENSHTWDYGDGNTGSQDSHTYSSPGTYSVCLTAINDCSDDTYCQNVTVVCELSNSFFLEPNQFNPSDPTISISMNPSLVGSDSHFWDMGDGSPIYFTESVSHTYAAAGTYSICLIAFNPCGQDVFCRSFTVTCDIPSADFEFYNNSNSANGLFTAFYGFDPEEGGGTYDFGDGNTRSSAPASIITHTYEELGTYSVCYTNSNDCGANTECELVIVSCIDPISDFTYVQEDPYYPLINFTPTPTTNDQSFNASENLAFTWDVGNGNGNTYNQENLTFIYQEGEQYDEIGQYTVTLITENSCGEDTTDQTITVQCLDPIADFTYEIDANNPYIIHFSNASLGQQFCQWDFGDGSTGSCGNGDISHTYAEGTYAVCLSISSLCGEDQFCLDIGIDINTCNPPAVYNATPTSTTTALATWEEVPDATFYQVKYRRKGTSPWTTVGTTSLQRNLPNLIPNKYYQYKIRSQCSDGDWSNFTDIQEFYTSTCEIPTGIESIYLDQTRVKIRWDANSNTYKNKVKYREIGTSTWLLKGNTPSKNFIYITGLNPNTDYEYSVRSKCNDDTWSAYSSKYFFSTDINNQVRLANNKEDNIHEISIYPNPVRDELNIKYSSAKSSETIFIITDISGKTIQQQVVSSDQGKNTLQMNTSQLVKGYYIISIQNSEKTTSRKFIKS